MLHRLNIEDKHHLLATCAAVVGDVSHEVPHEALGGEATVTLQPARVAAELLRYSNIPQPVDHLVIDPHGTFGVWVAETDDTAYIAVRDLHGLDSKRPPSSTRLSATDLTDRAHSYGT